MEDEKKVDLDVLAERLYLDAVKSQAKVEIVYKGNVFTVARAEWTDQKGKVYVGEGVSRKMYTDKPGVNVPVDLGDIVARGRALTAMLNKVMHRPPLKHARHITDYFKG
jgi:hypothetical protein